MTALVAQADRSAYSECRVPGVFSEAVHAKQFTPDDYDCARRLSGSWVPPLVEKTRLLKESRVPSHKRMAFEIHNCSRQSELIQDRAEFLQVLGRKIDTQLNLGTLR